MFLVSFQNVIVFAFPVIINLNAYAITIACHFVESREVNMIIDPAICLKRMVNDKHGDHVGDRDDAFENVMV